MQPSDILTRFDGVRRVNDGWMARCPAHDDHNPSLHITRTDNGVVLHCFAGCSYEDILRRAGLGPDDLRNGRPPGPMPDNVDYIYRDPTGRPVHLVRRWYKKDGSKSFLWFHWDNEKHTFVPGRGPEEPILYRLDELAHPTDRSVVYIPEGEKDVDRIRELGYVSTTNPGGAGKWNRARGSGQLSAFRKVIILADNDEPGRMHARQVYDNIKGFCKDIYTVDFRGQPGCDVSDFLDAGGKLTDILEGADHLAQSGRSELLTRRFTLTEGCGFEGATGGCDQNINDHDHLPEQPPVRSVQLDTVESESVNWLFTGRVAEGKLSLLDGDPGLGKSLVVLNWISLVSLIRGHPVFTPRQSKLGLMGGDREGRHILLLTAEDGIADTVVPRLKAAGADLSKISVVERSDGSIVSIPEDVPMLKELITSTNAKLLVIDPLVAYLSESVNANSDQSVRRALAPLKAMAEETGCAVLMIRHLNKNAQGTPMYRGGGSIAIIGASRVAMIVAKDPDVPDVRLIATIKSNIGVMPPTLQYRINPSAENPDIPVIEWLDDSTADASSILAPVKDRGDRNAIDEARAFLLEELNAQPLPAKEIQRRAAEAGITGITLRRAKQSLAVFSKKQEVTGAWTWCLPWHSDQDDHDH